MRQFYPVFYTKIIFCSCCYIKSNFKTTETYKDFFGEKAVRSPGKRGNVTLIHPMIYKPQIFTNVVLPCLVDKYVITFKIFGVRAWSDLMGLLQHLAISDRFAKQTPVPTRNIFLVVPTNNSPHKFQFLNFP